MLAQNSDREFKNYTEGGGKRPGESWIDCN
jgi:hypothetical protein